jgi:hypothetical protein
VSAAARVVAIDLPGFGHSDGRPELIAPDAMGTPLRAIEEWDWARRTRRRPGWAARRVVLAANARTASDLTIGEARCSHRCRRRAQDVIEALPSRRPTAGYPNQHRVAVEPAPVPIAS